MEWSKYMHLIQGSSHHQLLRTPYTLRLPPIFSKSNMHINVKAPQTELLQVHVGDRKADISIVDLAVKETQFFCRIGAVQ